MMQPLPQYIYSLLPYAEQEGWNLFWRFGRGWVIERVQEPDDGLPEIPSNEAAWEHVWANNWRDGIHRQVLNYLKESNTREYWRIASHCRSRLPASCGTQP